MSQFDVSAPSPLSTSSTVIYPFLDGELHVSFSGVKVVVLPKNFVYAFSGSQQDIVKKSMQPFFRLPRETRASVPKG